MYKINKIISYHSVHFVNSVENSLACPAKPLGEAWVVALMGYVRRISGYAGHGSRAER